MRESELAQRWGVYGAPPDGWQVAAASAGEPPSAPGGPALPVALTAAPVREVGDMLYSVLLPARWAGVAHALALELHHVHGLPIPSPTAMAFLGCLLTALPASRAVVIASGGPSAILAALRRLEALPAPLAGLLRPGAP